MKNKQSFFKRFLVAFVGLFSLTSTSLLVGCSSNTYTLTLVNENEEGGEIFGEGTYKAGSKVTLSYEANKEYTFTGWTINGEVIKTSGRFYQFEMPNEDITVTGNFDFKSFYVETDLRGYGNMAKISGDGIYKYGDTVTITVSDIVSGYEIKYWRINDEEEIYDSSTTFTFTMPLNRMKVICYIDYETIGVHFSSNKPGYSGYYDEEEGHVQRIYANQHQYMINIGYFTPTDNHINPETGNHYCVKKIDWVTSDGEFIKNEHTHTYYYNNPYLLNFDTTNEDMYVYVTYADYVNVKMVGPSGRTPSISCSNDYSNGKGYLFVGTQVTFSTYAYAGDVFDGWYVNDVYMSNGTRLTLTLSEDIVVEAKFSKVV